MGKDSNQCPNQRGINQQYVDGSQCHVSESKLQGCVPNIEKEIEKKWQQDEKGNTARKEHFKDGDI